jgi:fluoride exporter
VVAAIAVGGAVGAVARYGSTALLERTTPLSPAQAIVAVNLAGCFAIGLLLALLQRQPELSPLWRHALAVGLLGSFTTYSTFGHDTFELLETGRAVRAGAHVLAQVALGLVAVGVGRALALRLLA